MFPGNAAAAGGEPKFENTYLFTYNKLSKCHKRMF
jgi:hypothetical protein